MKRISVLIVALMALIPVSQAQRTGGGGRGGSSSSASVVTVAGDTICALHADTTIGAVSLTAVSSTASTMTYTMATVPAYFFVGQVVQAQGNTTTGYNALNLPITATTGTTVTVSSVANPGAGTAGGTMSMYCSNQTQDPTTAGGNANGLPFAATYAIAANSFGVTRTSFAIKHQFLIFSSAASVPGNIWIPFYNSTRLYTPSNSMTSSTSYKGVMAEGGWDINSVSSSLAMTTAQAFLSPGGSTQFGSTASNQPTAITTTGVGTISFDTWYAAATAGNAVQLISTTVR